MDETYSSHIATAYAARDGIVRSITSRFAGADAEEHVAEAYAQCCSANVNDADHAVRWVARAASHLAIDAKRDDSVARRHAPRLVERHSTESAEDRYLETELHLRIAAAVAALPPYQREVMQAYAEGARNSEIARRVGRSVDAVKQVISRTLRQLRQELRDAELAVIALYGRRRDRNSRRIGSFSLSAIGAAFPALLPTIAIAMGVTAPAAIELAARGAHRLDQAAPPTAGSATMDTLDSAASGARRAEARTPTRESSASATSRIVERAYGGFERHVDHTIDRAPRVPSSHAETPGHMAGRRSTRPYDVGYEPDSGDPVGDVTYCLTHVEIRLPTYVGCEPPS